MKGGICTNRKRVLLVSGAIILLCMTIIVGMTHALFTDILYVENHLQAGDLEASLTRTYLEYSVLNGDGELEVTKVEDDLDLTHSVDENVFGIDSKDLRIVPGSYFDAHLEIGNEGEVAFTYSVGIHLLGDSNALAEQLRVTITHPDETTTTAMLNEMISGSTVFTGRIKANDGEKQQFSVRVEFVDDMDYNKDIVDEEDKMDNDLAQTQLAVFDLVVVAVQSTTSTTTPAPSTTPANS